MPDADLLKSLSALRPPLASEAARERALHRATLAFAAARHAPAEPEPRHRARLVPAGFFATVAAAVLLLGAGLWMTPPSRIAASNTDSAADSAAQSRSLLAELNTLFPGQLNAVIDRDGVLQLDLVVTAADAASSAPAIDDQAIIMELQRDGRRLRILAYSGRTVRLELDGVSLRLDPLLTSTGDVLLAGDDFVWSSARPAVAIPADSLAGWQIAARPLALPL